MIGTFWNLCRACPSMPVDKLHSEYRSTYRWHEYTGPRQDVVRKAPQPICGNREEDENKYLDNTMVPSSGGNIEPALPRRKKNPTLAYRTNELLPSKKDLHHTSTSLDRARCAEREGERSSRRSKSEGPPVSPTFDYPPQKVLRSDSDPSEFAQQLMISNFPLENCRTGGLKSAISRISTEYRLQFAWPRGTKSNKDEDKTASNLPRKSLSMGAIRPNTGNTTNNHAGGNMQEPAPVHKKRLALADKTDGTGELEPLVADTDYVGEHKIQQECFSKEEKINISDKTEIKTEYKKKFRPFSQYEYVEGRFKPKREPDAQIIDEMQPAAESWFAEVLELRKKAGEYKHRGWGRELVPEHIAELYNKQMALWEQVSRRSSLSALSLASSTHRSISKEEKEQENNKKSSPTKAVSHHQTRPTSQKIEKVEEFKKEPPPRSRMDNFVRHHLERTTGVGVKQVHVAGEEGILHSPTREKLEPVIPRRKDAVIEINKSPQKTHHIGRSQSAGPNTGAQENRSPKRAARMVQAKSGEKRARPREKSEDTEPEASESERMEPVVKSPPEPTRVKSPEQILMRSPEPVNWTVPLDTGKTFTVTQNVVQGDVHCRAQSESKMRSESRVAPPAPPQSAPPQLPDPLGIEASTLETSTCLDEPSFSFDAAPTQDQKPPNCSDIMEKAHNRFDQFWGTTAQDNQDKTENV
ncbi:uncharacterized protein isoform X5 [Rhodnius prolixus]|uniref:uncharacterized protein isoform X5 n=1 Tax=Rhodnius prolixus TaxID=13249 RepID=UPI003D18BAE0